MPEQQQTPELIHREAFYPGAPPRLDDMARVACHGCKTPSQQPLLGRNAIGCVRPAPIPHLASVRTIRFLVTRPEYLLAPSALRDVEAPSVQVEVVGLASCV